MNKSEKLKKGYRELFNEEVSHPELAALAFSEINRRKETYLRSELSLLTIPELLDLYKGYKTDNLYVPYKAPKKPEPSPPSASNVVSLKKDGKRKPT